jgi:hypothetical protein
VRLALALAGPEACEFSDVSCVRRVVGDACELASMEPRGSRGGETKELFSASAPGGRMENLKSEEAILVPWTSGTVYRQWQCIRRRMRKPKLIVTNSCESVGPVLTYRTACYYVPSELVSARDSVSKMLAGHTIAQVDRLHVNTTQDTADQEMNVLASCCRRPSSNRSFEGKGAVSEISDFLLFSPLYLDKHTVYT